MDPAIQEILNYSPPPLEERIPLLPLLKEEFPLPPLLDHFPILSYQPDSMPIDREFLDCIFLLE